MLYLSILGSKEYPTYFDANSGENFSVKFIFTDVKAFSTHENSNAVSNDYKPFENMVAHALFSSSRRHGVKGIPFDSFISCVVGEFQDKYWQHKSLRLEDKEIVLSRLLEGYPCHDQYGCNFGHLTRAFNEERCDLYLQNASGDVLLLGECEYYQHNVGEAVLTKIITGLTSVCRNWNFVMLFCPRLVDFTSHRTIGCLKVNCVLGSVEWVFEAKESVFETRNRKRESRAERMNVVFEIGECKV